MRYELCQPLSQDILGAVEALWADPHEPDPPPFEIEPSRAYRADLEPPPLPVFLAPHQLDALECEHRKTHPYSHNERIEWQDVVRRVQVAPVRLPVQLAWELVRMPLLHWGVGVLERIAINVLAQAVDAEGVPIGAPILVGSNLTTPNPCPFPIPHPTPGAPALSLRFHLINYRTSIRVRDEPPMLTAAPPSAIPATDPVLSPWTDMRYQWGARYTEGHQWTRGGYSIWRLFMVVTGLASTVGGAGWTLDVCARLSGYTQQAGRDGAALRSTIVRH